MLIWEVKATSGGTYNTMKSPSSYKIDREDLDNNSYRSKNSGNIVFSRVKEADITICGKTIEEVITILKALDVENIANIEMTMENLNEYIKLYLDEQKRQQENIIENMFKEETNE